MKKIVNISLVIALTLATSTSTSLAMRPRAQSFRIAPTTQQPVARQPKFIQHKPQAGTLFTQPSLQARTKAATDIQRVWRGGESRWLTEQLKPYRHGANGLGDGCKGVDLSTPYYHKEFTDRSVLYQRLPKEHQSLVKTLGKLGYPLGPEWLKLPIPVGEAGAVYNVYAYRNQPPIEFVTGMKPRQQTAFFLKGGMQQPYHYLRPPDMIPVEGPMTALPQVISPDELRHGITTDPTLPPVIAALRAGLPTNFEGKNYQALFDRLLPEYQIQVSAAIKHPAQLAPAMRAIDALHSIRTPQEVTASSFLRPEDLRTLIDVSKRRLLRFLIGK